MSVTSPFVVYSTMILKDYIPDSITYVAKSFSENITFDIEGISVISYSGSTQLYPCDSTDLKSIRTYRHIIGNTSTEWTTLNSSLFDVRIIASRNHKNKTSYVLHIPSSNFLKSPKIDYCIVEISDTNFLYLVLHSSIENGKIKEALKFIVLNKQIFLVPEMSSLFKSILETHASFSLKLIPKNDLKIGHIYSNKTEDMSYIFLGEYVPFIPVSSWKDSKVSFTKKPLQLWLNASVLNSVKSLDDLLLKDSTDLQWLSHLHFCNDKKMYKDLGESFLCSLSKEDIITFFRRNIVCTLLTYSVYKDNPDIISLLTLSSSWPVTWPKTLSKGL